MKKTLNLLTVTAFAFSLLFAGTAFAGYGVRVKNSTGSKIKVIYAKYRISTWENCLPFNKKKISNGSSKRCVIRNVFNSAKHKWKIKYRCNSKNYTKSSSTWKAKSGSHHSVTKFTITACGSVTVQTKIYE